MHNDRMPLVIAIFTVSVLALAWASGRWALAVYLLSFWHYAVYVLAFFWRSIPHARFKQDALVLRTLSLAALAYALIDAQASLPSLAVMAAGFALNFAAVRALGADRTYYGVELGGMAEQRIDSFPFNTLPHPMLFGNVIAFAAPLLDPEFRADWWPLAVIHVALNLFVIAQESWGEKSALLGTVFPCAALALGSVLLLSGFAGIWPFALAAALLATAFGAMLFRRYTRVDGDWQAGETPT